MALLLSDDFNRADNASAIGSPSVGGPYTVRVGTWGINTNRAYTSVSTANSHVTFPGAVDVDIQVTMVATGGNSGPLFRWVDASNYWFIAMSTSGYSIQRLVAGSAVTLFTTSSRMAVAGDVCRVIAKGRFIFFYVNGSMAGQCEDNFYASATSTCGMRINSSTSTRFDDLTANDAPATIPGGNDGAIDVQHYYDLGVGATAPYPLDSFMYKGRNTKTEDEGAEA